MKTEQIPHHKCKHHRSSGRINGFGLLSMGILALLPKCPFCILAYSSTALLCSKDGLLLASSHTTVHATTLTFVLIFGLITIAAIAFNYKGRKTILAVFLSLLGLSLAVLSTSWGGGQWLYYSGILFLFAAVWLNGSLLWLIKQRPKQVSAL